GRFGHEKCTGDLRRRESAERAQRQGDLSFLREGRVAAREDEPQTVVEPSRHIVVLCEVRGGRRLSNEEPLLLGANALAAETIERLATRRRHDPPGGRFRDALSWPVHNCRGEGLLERVLSDVEIACEANQRCEDAPGSFTKYAFDDLVGGGHDAPVMNHVLRSPYIGQMGRTSI